MRRVAIVMGGRSGEHDISLLSGSQVLQNIDRARNLPVPVVLTRDNRWKIWGEWDRPPEAFAPGDPSVEERPPGDALNELRRLRVDVIFPALHGPYGEDGRIQGFFEMAGLAYVGSGHTASALCMDKVQSKRLFEWAGIATPEWRLLSGWPEQKVGESVESLERAFGYPMVLKTPCLGSSVCLAIPLNREALLRFLADLPKEDDRVIVERYIRGRELTCAVLDGPSGPESLPPTEIIPRSSFYFDYEAKYTPGATEEITPAEITGGETLAIQGLAAKIHRLMGCRGMSRSDFILAGETFWALEVNTIPGMTRQSLLPQAAACAGISFTEMIERLLDSAIRRKQ